MVSLAVFSDDKLAQELHLLCKTFPWIFQQEARIFESFDKTHFVLRIPSAGTFVVREDSNQMQNIRLFLSSVRELCGSAGCKEISDLVTTRLELLRSIQRGGAVIFRAISDYPRDMDESDLVSLREVLPNSDNMFIEFDEPILT